VLGAGRSLHDRTAVTVPKCWLRGSVLPRLRGKLAACRCWRRAVGRTYCKHGDTGKRRASLRPRALVATYHHMRRTNGTGQPQGNRESGCRVRSCPNSPSAVWPVSSSVGRQVVASVHASRSRLEARRANHGAGLLARPNHGLPTPATHGGVIRRSASEVTEAIRDALGGWVAVAHIKSITTAWLGFTMARQQLARHDA
jgi:hypothetical protein